MVSRFAAGLLRGLCLRGFWLSAALGSSAGAVVQLASGTPLDDGETTVVRVPLYFFTDETITAGQFDVSVPEGWKVLQVDGGAGAGLFSVDAEALAGGGVRVVLFSIDASEIPIGPLGTVVMEPPSIGEIANLTFSNPLFVGDGENTVSITPGFPALQIVSQPLGQTVLAGQSAVLSVSALAIDPTYAWFEGTAGDVSNPVGGSASLFQTPTLLADTPYWVRVTDTFGESVDSQTAAITVDTGPTYVFSPNSVAVGWRAGSGSASLRTPVNNAWSASSSAAWLTVGTSSGTGPGSIAFSFEVNNSLTSRSAQIAVGGVTYTVNQSARPSMFADYPTIGETTWRFVPWFGYVTDTHYPWVYHRDHGWLYVLPTANLNGFFAYSTQGDLGWLYISSSFYNGSVRWIYSFRYQSYLFFYPNEALNPTSRLFYHANEKRWFSFPED